MDTDSFTDLLSAAMSESGLIDLEASNDQPVGDSRTQFVTNSQPVIGIATSQQLTRDIQTNSIIVRCPPRLQSPAASLQPAAIHTSAVTQRGVHKIVIRPMPAGVQQSVSSRQLQPVVLHPAGKRQPLLHTVVTSAGQPSVAVVRPILPVLRTTTPHAGSSTIGRPQTAQTVSAVNIPSTTIRPALNPGTLRFTAIPRQLAGRLPTGESGLSLQIRPRLPISTIQPRTAAQTTGAIKQHVGQTISCRPRLIATVLSSASSLVPLRSSSSSTTAVVTVSSLPGTGAASVARLTASSADECATASSVASSVGCVSSVPVVTSMPHITSCDSIGNTNLTSLSADSGLSVMRSNMISQPQTRNDSCSAVISSRLSSSDAETARCVPTAGTGTVSTGHVNGCLSMISSGYVHTSSSLEQSGAMNNALTSSENLTVTASTSETVNTDTETVAGETMSARKPATNSVAANAEADDQQVRFSLLLCVYSNLIKYFTNNISRLGVLET